MLFLAEKLNHLHLFPMYKEECKPSCLQATMFMLCLQPDTPTKA